jgi:hypothetical protein
VYRSLWENALQSLLLGDGPSLDGLEVLLDFGPLWGICPPEVLLTSPAAAIALTVAAAAHRGELGAMAEQDLAAAACRVRDAVVPGGAQDRHYAEVLLSVQGGAGYAEPGAPPVNVQQLVPPDSMLLALVPQLKASRGKQPFDEPVKAALAHAHRQGAGIMQAGDEGLSALFGMDGLAQEQTTMLYGLLRVRQMLDEFLEYVGDPYVDNDRLAEVCDEESAILADCFGFPAEAYAAVRAAAGEAGALGAKLTWAFGGLPAAILIAPGRRQTVQKALRRAVPQAHVLPLDLDTTGLSAAEAL